MLSGLIFERRRGLPDKQEAWGESWKCTNCSAPPPLPPRDERSGVRWRNIHAAAAASQSQLSSTDVTSHVKKKSRGPGRGGGGGGVGGDGGGSVPAQLEQKMRKRPAWEWSLSTAAVLVFAFISSCLYQISCGKVAHYRSAAVQWVHLPVNSMFPPWCGVKLNIWFLFLKNLLAWGSATSWSAVGLRAGHKQIDGDEASNFHTVVSTSRRISGMSLYFWVSFLFISPIPEVQTHTAAI